MKKLEEGTRAEMSFVDHLEQLRWHLLRSIIAIAILSVFAFLAKDLVFHRIVLGPSRVDFISYKILCKLGKAISTDALCFTDLNFKLLSRKMTGQFTMHVTYSLVAGVILAFPYFFWEVWRFIKPGLYSNEKNAARGTVFFVSLLFLGGVSFGYFIITPLSVRFLAQYELDASIQNQFDVTSYVSIVMMLVLACGIMFQLPVVTYFLSKVGLVTPKLMKTYRRHALFVIIILSAIITPPDIFSLVLIAMPIFVLYEVSIGVSAIVNKKNKKRYEEQNSDW